MEPKEAEGTVSATPDSVESTIATHRNPACAAGENLGAQITELCGYIYAANYRLLVMIREFDEGGYAQWLGLYSTAHWLNFKCGIGMNAAREKVRVELAMERQFQAADGCSEGDTSEPALQKPNAESARRADGLAEVAESYHNAKSPQGSSADRCQVVVHVHAEDESADLEDGPHVSADQVPSGQTSRRIASDCSRIKVTEDGTGEPLSVGRKTRSIPRAIRRALRFRDKGCRFPGCTNTRFVDGHHIQHRADGGETSLDNLVQLCRHHHRLVHEGGFGCERDVDGNLVFRSPVVGKLQDQVPLKPVDTSGDPREWSPFTNPNIEIDPDTCISEWRAGENIDWHLAVGHLYQLPFKSAV
jgi:hypothetical protein